MERNKILTKYRREIDSLFETGKECYDLKYLICNDGEISMVIDENIIIITESGSVMGELSDENICFVDFEGNQLITEGNQRVPERLPYHLRLYNSNRNLRAVICSCPPVLTAISMTESGLIDMQKIDSKNELLSIPKCFTSEELLSSMTSAELGEYTANSKGILIKNGGALFYSDNSIFDAVRSMYVIENVANSLLLAKGIQ